MARAILAMFIMAVAMCGCTTTRESSPTRTATEQLLISAAADRAAEKLTLDVLPGSSVYVDASYFDAEDGRYAISAIRERMLTQGARLAPDRASADMVVEIRAGALSIDENGVLVGMPGFEVPLPLSGPVALPEIAFFKKENRIGVAKFAATAYDPETGRLADATGPQYGFSHQTHWVVLLLVSWTTSDIMPGLEEGADGSVRQTP